MSRTENWSSEVSMRGLCMDLLRNLWMIVLAVVTMWCASTGLHNLTYQPAYTSSATLVIGVKGDSNIYSSLSLASQMAEVFGQVFQSDALREKIAADVGADVQGTISCSLVTQTNLLVVKATSSQPRQAYLYLNSALEHYEGVSDQIFSNAELQILQEPDVPLAPSNTSFFLKYQGALMAAAAVGMAVLISICYMVRFTVKTTEAARTQLDGPIQGTIPFERRGMSLGKKRKKKAFLLDSPEVSMNFAEAVRNTGTRLEHHMRHHGHQVLLVTSVGENEGKSTLAANLALALAEKHKRVLLVDADLRKPALHKILETQGKESEAFSQVLEGVRDWKELAQYHRKRGLWILFQFLRAKNPGGVLQEPRMGELLARWKEQMDYVVVDCSPISASADAEIWMSAVDSVLLVVREDWADVRHINDSVDIVRQNSTDFAGFVLNAFRREWGDKLREHQYAGYETYSGRDELETQQRGPEPWKK